MMFGFSVASGELGRMDLREAEREEYLERRKERKSDSMSKSHDVP